MGAYLDHNATVPMVPEARRALLEAADETWANPSGVYREGQRARYVVEEARAQVAALVDRYLGCDPPASAYELLRYDFGALVARHGRVVGRRIPTPKLVKV